MRNTRALRVFTAAAIASGALLLPATTAQAAEDFYSIPATLPAANGSVIKTEASSFYVDPLKLVSANAEVTRVMYKSTNNQGQAIATTSTVLVPRSAWRGKGERPLVAMTPGTKGNGDQCAPSKRLALGEDYEGLIVKGLLAAGYAVTVPDYEGVGTAPKSTYMAKFATGNAVLDSLRAAQNLAKPGIPKAGPVLIAGYSQGGEASAAASELASSYAPELNILGAYAGAVPADLVAVAEGLDGGAYQAFLLSAVSGISTAEGIDTKQFLNADGLAAVAKNDQLCTIASIPGAAFRDTSKYTLSGQKLSVVAKTNPMVKAALQKQQIGLNAPKKFPVLVAQSYLDDVIPAAQARTMAKQWCTAGATVEYQTSVVPTHVGAAVRFLPNMFGFLANRVDGRTPINNCWMV